jgi:prefoldin beta subunit
MAKGHKHQDECEDDECGPECGHNHSNPLANLDEETQQQIQELQMLEHNFQQLLMQKNAFSMEANETDYIIKEVGNATGEVSRIIGNQVIIKSTKEKILEDMKNKQKLIDTRMKQINEQEKKFSEQVESLRENIMKKIQG